MAERGISRSTAYKWRSELGIEPEKRRTGTRMEVWLSAADEALLNAYGDALTRGATTAQALAMVGRTAPTDTDGAAPLVPVDSNGLQRTAPTDTDGDLDAHPTDTDGGRQIKRLRSRLAALRDAVELGAPLTTAEVALLLGARPGGDEVIRGRLRAIREGRNCWTIEPD
jgi:hypothetical protein